MGDKIPPQNLIKQISVEEATRPPGHSKAIVLDAGTILSAVLVSFALKFYLENQNGTAFSGLVGALTVFSIFSAFAMMLTRSWSRRIFVIVLEVLALLSFFYAGYSISSLSSVALVGFLFFLWGDIRGKQEANNSLEMQFFRIVRPQLNKIVTGVVLTGVLLYLPHSNSDDALISQTSFNSLYGFSGSFASKIYPEINFNASIGEFARSLAKTELQNDSDYKELEPAEQNEALTNASDQVTQNLSKSLGTKIDKNESMSSVLYGFAVRTIHSWRDNFGRGFTIVWAIALFFIFRSFGALFALVVSLIVFLIYQFMIALNVVRIVGESRVHETVEYT